MATTPEQAAAWAAAQAVRHGGRRAEDRGIALAVHTGLQMVRDRGPDTVPVSPPYLPMDSDGDPLGHALADWCQQHGTECCADTSDQPRRPLLTLAGRMWLGYFTALGAIAAAVFLIRR